ncbi:MAG: ECF transporter S component [Clostridiales bacterium]|nr:ECF transporter S component [Clostridiales bacterium]MDD7387582.1 ECF transporter S component [Bacillota bacterium]MDY6041588.1 ECF transporter S component [Candidatus Faecousia sp.]
MSETAMWLLLAAVVILIVFASVLYKRKFSVREIATIGVMAALSLVAYLFFRIPFYGGSSFHLGNTFTALTALLLDGVSGGLAGAIGLALADILAGDPGYAVTTFILKFLIGITCGAVAHKVFRLKSQKTDDKKGIYLVKVIASAGSGLLLNVFTDPFLGYFRNVYIFGQEYTVAQALTKIAGGVTFVNSVVSTVCAVILYLALRPVLARALPENQR